jgi:hypothetical protein
LGPKYGFEKKIAIGEVAWDIQTGGKDDVLVLMRYRGVDGAPVECTMKLDSTHTYDDAKKFVVALENYRYVYVYMYVYKYVCLYMYIYVYLCIYTYIYVHVCMCIYVHICECICEYMYTYTYIHVYM